MTSQYTRRLLISIPMIMGVLSWSGFLGHARNAVSDLLFIPRTASDAITIIAIDEESIQAIGQWPWPRATYAQALAQLQDARVIGIDVNFKEPSRLGSTDDRLFMTALRASSVPVILASELQPDGGVILPIPALASVSQQGIANVTVDSDGIMRTIRLQRNGFDSFAALAAQHASASMVLDGHLRRIHYRGPSGTIPTVSFIDVIQGRVPTELLKDRIVLIGATAHDLQDYQNTPFGLMSGVEIQATIVANVLAKDFLKTAPLADVLLVLLVGFGALGVGLRIGRIWVRSSVLLGMVAVVWVLVFVAFTYGVLLDVVIPTLAILVSGGAALLERYSATTRERRFIHDTFSRYLAPQVVAELLRDPSRVRLGGERRELTILFSDIRGFTTLSEAMPPQDLGHFLNRYLSVMTDLILERRGVIDKYIGDAIMAFWGAPLDDPAHALHGVQSALAMVQALENFNRESVELGKPAIAVGIGLNAGTVTVGNMGSEKRFDYTIIGDEVNLASRLEGLTKTYGVNIIVSAAVLEQIGSDTCRTEGIMTREIDRVRVKGKTKPVVIHEVMPPGVLSRIGTHQHLFEQGLAHYYGGRWAQAAASLEVFLEQVSHDGPAELIRERCREFLETPPEEWNGAYEMTHK